MGWGFCGEDSYGREMGYGIVAQCDEKGCLALIDRGLGYVCGDMHEGGDHGCGGYFCSEHLMYTSRRRGQFCKRCARRSGSGLGHWLSRLPKGGR